MNDAIVRGHHGTSRRAASAILANGFKASSNEYDWLGDGVYFFQDAPRRALEWARGLHGTEGVVIESSIRLIDCMDMLDIEWRTLLAEAHDGARSL